MGSNSSEDELWGLEGGSRDSFEPVPLFESNSLGSVGDVGKRSYDMSSQFTEALPAISRRKKKSKGMPKRPSPYALFFSRERDKLLESHGRANLSFEDLERIIGTRWKELSTDERKEFEDLASQDSERYRTEMESFIAQKKKEASPQHLEAEALDDTQPLPPLHSASHYQRMPEFSAEEAYHRSPPPPEHHYSAEYHTGTPPNYRLAPVISESHVRTGTHHPPPHPAPVASVDLDVFPIPPGMELMLPDRAGVERKFRVEYACYTMTRDAAEDYINQLTSAITHRGPPPPPPQQGARPPWAGPC